MDNDSHLQSGDNTGRSNENNESITSGKKEIYNMKNATTVRK